MKLANEQELLPPHDLNAEASVLGSILIDPAAIHELVTLKASDFYDGRNGAIFGAMRTMMLAGVEPDIITLKPYLTHNYDMAYLIGLLAEVPTSVRVQEYARIVYEASKRRQIIRAAQSVANFAYDASSSLPEVLESTSKALIDVGVDGSTSRVQYAKEVASRVAERIMERQAGGAGQIGLSTGFTELDSMLRGVQSPGLYVLAARPGLGKTAFAQHWVWNIASPGGRVMFFTLEMLAEQIFTRMVAQQAGLSYNRVNEGDLNQLQLAEVMRISGELSQLNVVIDDTGAITASQIQSKVMREIATHGPLDLVVIDYLQLMGDDGKENRVRSLGRMTKALKSMAKGLNIPILLLAQLSRKVEERANKRPMLSDLRDSGEIEEDADVVMFLYRDSYYASQRDPGDEFDYSKDPNVAEVNVAKNRNGEQGSRELHYDITLGRFGNLEKHEREL